MNLGARVEAPQGDAEARAAVIDDRGGLDRGSHVARYPGAQRAHHRFRIFDAGTFADIGNVGHLDRRIFLLGGLHWHRTPLILHRDMRHGVDELSQEVDLRTLHQARHHDREAYPHGHAGHADEGLPHSGADVSPCDAEQKFHGGYRLLLMKLRRASLTTESMWAVMAAEITASSGSEGAVVTEATTVASGGAPG